MNLKGESMKTEKNTRNGALGDHAPVTYALELSSVWLRRRIV
jgi:hypothetical protein